MSLNSPENYSIAKAYVAFKPKNSTAFLPVGNVPQFDYNADVQYQEHFSSQVGPRVQDADIPIQVGANISITLDEITALNVAMAVNGSVGVLTQTAATDESVSVGDVVAEEIVDIGYLNVSAISFVDGALDALVEGVDYRVISHEAGIYQFTASQTGVTATVSAPEIAVSDNRSVIEILNSPDGIEGEFLVIGTGTGRRLKGVGIYANIRANTGLGMITEDFQTIEVTGRVIAQPGQYPYGRFIQQN